MWIILRIYTFNIYIYTFTIYIYIYMMMMMMMMMMIIIIIIIIINHQRSTTKGLFRLARWSRQGHGAIWWFFPDTLGWLWQLKTLQYTAVSHVFVCFLLVNLHAIYKTIQIRWEDNCTIHVVFFVATPYAACVSTIINPKKESIFSVWNKASTENPSRYPTFGGWQL